MHNLWNDAEAAASDCELELRVCGSRLFGQEQTLVLHGGGITSVKIHAGNKLNEEQAGDCCCRHAPEHAILTAPEARAAAMIVRLDAVAGGMLQ